MKKLIKLLVVFFMLTPLAVSAEATTVKFNKNYCRTVNQDPIITVCVGGNPENAKFRRKAAKALKKETKALLGKFSLAGAKKVKAASSCTYYDWDPTICDPGQERDYCDVYPSDPLCEEPDPPPSTCTYYDWDPDFCDPSGQGRDYCDVYPSDPHCEPPM